MRMRQLSRTEILQEIQVLTEAVRVMSNPWTLEDRIVSLTKELDRRDKEPPKSSPPEPPDMKSSPPPPPPPEPPDINIIKENQAEPKK